VSVGAGSDVGSEGSVGASVDGAGDSGVVANCSDDVGISAGSGVAVLIVGLLVGVVWPQARVTMTKATNTSTGMKRRKSVQVFIEKAPSWDWNSYSKARD